jgi:hypothetical protein
MNGLISGLLIAILFVSINTLIYGVTAVIMMYWHNDILMINPALWPGIVFYPVLWGAFALWVGLLFWIEFLRLRG